MGSIVHTESIGTMDLVSVFTSAPAGGHGGLLMMAAAVSIWHWTVKIGEQILWFNAFTAGIGAKTIVSLVLSPVLFFGLGFLILGGGVRLHKHTIPCPHGHCAVRYLITTEHNVDAGAIRPRPTPNKIRSANMKSLLLIPAVAGALALGGCVVQPVRPAYVAPPGVVYVAPTYVSPGPGYVWEYHSHYGWGWHHPQYGWHRGWR